MAFRAARTQGLLRLTGPLRPARCCCRRLTKLVLQHKTTPPRAAKSRRRGRPSAAGRADGKYSTSVGVNELAHRLVLWLLVGPPPPRCRGEWEAMHACDNKRCIHPGHLFWGTRAANLVRPTDPANSIAVGWGERLQMLRGAG